MSKKGIYSKYSEFTVDRNGNIHEIRDKVQKKKRIMNGIISVFCTGGLITTGYFLIKNGTWKGINDVDTKSMSSSSNDDLSSSNNSDIVINIGGAYNSDTVSESNSDLTSDSITSESNTSDVVISLEGAEPVYKKMTAEDVVKLSKSFAEYLNKEATLSHVNYKFSEIEATDLYSVIYLANIDNISKEETKVLIENGLISDNIQKNIENSFYFYNLYTDDTINKIEEGKTNLIDLSLILSDKNDIKTFNTMNKIMTDSISNTSDENYKNYMDTVFYYASDVTIYNNKYDYSKSIYETDRDKLTVGGNYTLSFMATTIDFISFNNGVSNKYASKILQSGANDFANVVNIFNGCKIDDETIEKDKQYTK